MESAIFMFAMKRRHSYHQHGDTFCFHDTTEIIILCVIIHNRGKLGGRWLLVNASLSALLQQRKGMGNTVI